MLCCWRASHPSLRTPIGDPIHVRMKAEKCIAIPRSRRQSHRES